MGKASKNNRKLKTSQMVKIAQRKKKILYNSVSVFLSLLAFIKAIMGIDAFFSHLLMVNFQIIQCCSFSFQFPDYFFPLPIPLFYLNLMWTIYICIYIFMYIYGLLQLYPGLKFDVIWALIPFDHLSDGGELDGVLSHTPPLHRKTTFSEMSNRK